MCFFRRFVIGRSDLSTFSLDFLPLFLPLKHTSFLLVLYFFFTVFIKYFFEDLYSMKGYTILSEKSLKEIKSRTNWFLINLISQLVNLGPDFIFS